jgi:co-chaperonin GroES (HSP10)
MHLLGFRVIIVPDLPSNKTLGGIWIPENQQVQRNTGTVVLIGDEVDKKFDKRRVFFNKIAKTEIVHEGIDCVMLYVHDIIAIIE